MDDDKPKVRYRIGINAISLEETDETVASAEEIAAGDIGFAEILKNLPTDKQRFIALALYQGWNQTEIAFVLHCDRTNIVHIVDKMRKKLAIHRVRYKSQI